MLAKLKSRKLWAAVLGAALSALGTGLGLDEEQVTKAVYVIVAYLLGQGIADHGAARSVAARGFASVSVMLGLVAGALAALLLSSCAHLETLTAKAAEAQREAAAVYDLVEAIRTECETMDDPRPEVCQQADAAWEYVEPLAQRLGAR